MQPARDAGATSILDYASNPVNPDGPQRPGVAAEKRVKGRGAQHLARFSCAGYENRTRD